MKKIYFAHNMLDYGTEKEKNELKKLNEIFYDCEIINPRDCDEEFLATNSDEKNFSFWYNKVDECEILVYTTHEGFIGRGVLAEITHAFKNEKEVYYLNENGIFIIQSSKISGTIDFSTGKYYFKPRGTK